MYNNYILLIISIICVEAITEVVIKSVIFNNIRNFFMGLSTFFQYLLTCGYCFSFWASLFILIILSIFGKIPVLVDSIILNYFLLFFIIQRGSNILHGIIDRYCDTRKDIRYNNKE